MPWAPMRGSNSASARQASISSGFGTCWNGAGRNFPIKLAAHGVIGGKHVVRQGRPQADGRAVREAFLTVLDQPSFRIEPITLSARVEQNQSTTFEVQVRRDNGFTGEIQVSAEGYT